MFKILDRTRTFSLPLIQIVFPNWIIDCHILLLFFTEAAKLLVSRSIPTHPRVCGQPGLTTCSTTPTNQPTSRCGRNNSSPVIRPANQPATPLTITAPIPTLSRPITSAGLRQLLPSPPHHLSAAFALVLTIHRRRRYMPSMVAATTGTETLWSTVSLSSRRT